MAIHEQQIIARSGFERHLTHRDAPPHGKINRLVILNDPARRDELRIYLFSGWFLWSAGLHFPNVTIWPPS